MYRATIAALLFSISSGLSEPIVLDKLPLLFPDDEALLVNEGTVRTFHEAETAGKPVLAADRPWEGGRTYLYGNVVFDPAAEKFTMWYSIPKPSSLLYATSPDGVTWEKPDLTIAPAPDSPHTNIVLSRLHSPSVLFDEAERDPARRFKLMGKGEKGYFCAVSADGVHWIKYPRSDSIPKGDDTLVLSTDPRTGEYLLYHKRLENVRGYKRRVVYLSRSKDFQNWSPSALVFAPDEQDDAWATVPGERCEVYNMSVYPHAGGFIGFPTLFHVVQTRKRSELLPNQSPDDGAIDVQMASSSDGTRWSRSPSRTIMIPRGAKGDFDKGAILGLATQLVHHGDKTWIYYTGVSTTHGAPIPPKEIAIGRAGWRLDGFVSLDAQEAGGTIETKPVKFTGSRLLLNADAAGTPIRIALKEADGSAIPGYGFADCLPVTADGVSVEVRWKRRDQIPTGRPLRVRIEMTAKGRLFSISSSARNQ